MSMGLTACSAMACCMLQVAIMSIWANDFRFAIRLLSKHKQFAAMAVATLAIAIGANTAIFSVTRAVLLDPLPYPNAAEIVMLWEDATRLGFPKNTPAPGNYAEWKAQNGVFQGMGASRPRSYNLTGIGEPERLQGRQVTHDFFAVLGVTPLLGRPFIPEDDKPDAAKVAVISAALWQSRFGAASDVVGKTVLLDGTVHTIVGVMPPGFDFPSKGTQIWTPIALSSEDLVNRSFHYLQVVARLKPGVSLKQAQQEMDALAERLQKEYPATNTNVGVRVVSLRDEIVGDTRTAVLLLLAIAGAVLLIACANLANILLARSISRQREIGVRIALGAGRGRLIRQLFIENVIVSGVGVVLGLLLAQGSLEFLSVLLPQNLTSARLVLDARLLLFACSVGALTTVLFGAVPVRQAWHLGVVETLGHGGSRSGENRKSHRLRSWLVASQTAFTFMLLVAAGLMLRSLFQLRSIDPGFRGDNVLTMRTALPLPRYRGVAPRAVFYSGVVDEVRGLPGVVDAGFTSWLPYTNYGGTSAFVIEGRAAPPPGQINDANIRLVTPGYLTAIGVSLIEGRLPTSADHAGTEPVTVINRTMARQFWPGEDPLDHRIRICPDCPFVRIVGVISDIHQKALEVEVRPEYFIPFDQVPQAIAFAPPQDLAIRVAGDPAALAPAVRRAIWSVDPNQPVAQVRVLADYLAEDLAPRGFQTRLTAAFALVALLVASLGIYGVLSYAVSQRRREIGVRIALGATRIEILRFITVHGIRPALAGLVIGFGAAFGLARLISSLLAGVNAHDSITFASAAAVLVLTALVACSIPALRAANVDPGKVLHYE